MNLQYFSKGKKFRKTLFLRVKEIIHIIDGILHYDIIILFNIIKNIHNISNHKFRIRIRTSEKKPDQAAKKLDFGPNTRKQPRSGFDVFRNADPDPNITSRSGSFNKSCISTVSKNKRGGIQWKYAGYPVSASPCCSVRQFFVCVHSCQWLRSYGQFVHVYFPNKHFLEVDKTFWKHSMNNMQPPARRILILFLFGRNIWHCPALSKG